MIYTFMNNIVKFQPLKMSAIKSSKKECTSGHFERSANPVDRNQNNLKVFLTRL